MTRRLAIVKTDTPDTDTDEPTGRPLTEVLADDTETDPALQAPAQYTDREDPEPEPEPEPAAAEIGHQFENPIPLAEVFEDRGLAIEGVDMSFDEWARFGPNLLRMEDASPFWLGDWAAYGDERYGDDIWQVIDSERWKPKTILNYRWVAAQIPRKDRIPTLSWSHHRIAAELPTLAQRRKVLKKAAKDELTTRELQAIVDELKGAAKDDGDQGGGRRKAKTTHTWTLSFTLVAEDENAGDRIHEILQAALAEALQENAVEPTKVTPSKS